jgi:SAM-dependent methyltransferase
MRGAVSTALLFIGAVAVAIAAVVVGWFVADAPVPFPGDAIDFRSRYRVDTDGLGSALAMERWSGGRSLAGSTQAGLLVAGQMLATKFVQSRRDDALDHFLRVSAAATATRWGQVCMHAKEQVFWALQHHLGWSRPDASGALELAQLHVASEAQLRALIHASAPPRPPSGPAAPLSLLDVGSGTGTETAKLSRVLRIDAVRVTCVETSAPLRSTLRSLGFQTSSSMPAPRVLGARRPDTSSSFSHAALLNVLDRCDDPHGLLAATIERLRPGGVLLLAIVLPFRPLVYYGRVGAGWGSPASRQPRRPLDVKMPPHRGPFELQAASVMEAVLRRHPHLTLAGWTKLPYVSSGDTVYTHYTVDMALMVFQLASNDQGDQ